MTLVTLDFETYFDEEYSLKKMTTEAYVRDPRFEVLCVCTKQPDKQVQLSDSQIVAHHAHFEGLILSNHYNITPAFWFDTLSMARFVFPLAKSHSLESLAAYFGLFNKTVPYKEFKGKRSSDMDLALRSKLIAGCQHDVELTYTIFKKLLPYVPKEELKLIDLTIRMFTEPTLRLDRDRLQAYAATLAEKQDDLLESTGATKTDLGSAAKFAAILEKLGIEVPKKISPRTGKETYAFAKTDPGFQELLNHEDEVISQLAEARLNVKSTIGVTRSSRLLGMDERGALPVYLNFCGAHTSRWSGGDGMNFQNFPRGGEMRKSLLATEGHVLCVVDASQIECRILNWLAKEEWVLGAFRENRDLYSEMASSFYGYEVNKKEHPQERFVGKTLVLGAGYGIGWKKLQATLKNAKVLLNEIQARRAVGTYRHKHPNVVKLWETANWVIGRMYADPEWSYQWGPMSIKDKLIQLPSGFNIDFSYLKKDKEGFFLDNPRGRKHIYGGKLVENVVQGLARVFMGEAMLAVARRYKIVTCTHDEIVYLAPAAKAEEALKFGLDTMRTAPRWALDLPLDAEGGYDARYSK